jgi:hypothetical protein
MNQEEENQLNSNYVETLLYGLIDGLSADFDVACPFALYGVVNGGFRINEYKKVVDPRNSIKF